MSSRVRGLLLAVLALELAVGGWVVGRRALRSPPALPAELDDDPLLEAEIREVAARADRGLGWRGLGRQDAAAWRTLGESLLGRGFYAEAEQAFARAVALDPRDVDAAFGLAFCVDRTGRVVESIPLYRRCLDLPDTRSGQIGRRPFALYAIGRNHLRLEDVAAAEAAFRENDGLVAANVQLAKLLVHEGRPGEASRIIDGLLEQLPLALELHQLRARLLEAAGAADEAFLARAAEERSAHLIESNYNTDYVRPFTRRHGLAREFDAIERLLPPVAGDAQRDPRCLRGRIEPLVAAVAGRRIPQRVTLAYLEADLAAAGGEGLAAANRQADPAADLAAQLATIDAAGDHSVSRLELEAAVREIEGRDDLALELLERAVAMAPTAQLHGRLAEAYDRRGDEPRSRHHLARRHFHLGKAVYRRNRLDDALREFREAAALDPRHVATWFHVGEMEHHLGRSAAAIEAFRRVLELEPDHERARTFVRILEE